MLGAGAAAAVTVGLTSGNGVASAHTPPRQRPAGQAEAAAPATAAQAAAARLLPDHAGQIRFAPLDGGRGNGGGGDGTSGDGGGGRAPGDRFRVSGRAGDIEIAGTTAAAMLTGLHWYLKYTCGAHLSWAGSRTDLPARLPAPARPHEQRATVPHRFALNDTHDGYTAPYADWAHWERFLDVAALHGCNELLVTAGSEAVYHRLLRDFGYGDEEVRRWIPAPSHQPWWLLQNMSGYGGPISPQLLKRRTELGQRIVARMRELGMRPVLPGFFGTVPADFAERNPGGTTVPQGTWNGLPRPAWLDPRTAVFRKTAAAFYAHQRELFGEIGHFKMDLLHEGGDPGEVPVAEAARAVESALQTARPGATWVILGWQHNPRRELLDALAHKDRMLIVDGLSDLERITDREADFGGVPYAFGTIPNFGGRTTLGAKTHMWTKRFTAWRDRAGSTLAGTAYMPEATHRDPAAFELFSELAWREEAVDRERWFADYAQLRYGSGPGRADAGALRATAALRDTAYEISSADGRPHDSIFAARPSVTARSGTYYATQSPAFDLPAFDAALDGLLSVGEGLRGSDAYRYDLADVARQALANRSWLLIGQLRAAYEERDLGTFQRLSRLWLSLMRMSDDVAGTHGMFLLGPWLDAARRSAGDARAAGAAPSGEESAQLEHSARALITTWAGRSVADGGHLANYANRDWHGLIGQFHLPQWQTYLDELEDALREQRKPKTFDWYAVEEPWTRKRDAHPLRPVGDAYTTARRARDLLAKAPYQGSLRVEARPEVLAPGASGELSAVFRNENGLRHTGRVDFTLHGTDRARSVADPRGATSADRVAPGGETSARWRVKAPSEGLRKPLEPLAYTVEVAYGPEGEPRVTTRARSGLFVGGPLEKGLATYTNSQAVFGQLGERFAIHGGGRDLWRNTAEFGAVYRAGALRDGGSVTVEVTSQAATGPWARAGIIVRDELKTPGSPGFLNLAVTPDNGVVLSHDADGDGLLDTNRRVAGVSSPVLLRVTRAGTTFTGELSRDGGGSWRTVGSAKLPAAAEAQDAGLFMTAANAGSAERGTVEFTGWRTTGG
nr:alpha-N-acetylglucosaminidase [Streptomyces sp. HNM0574]